MAEQFVYNKECALLYGYCLSAMKNLDQLHINLEELVRDNPGKETIFHKLILYQTLKYHELLNKEEKEYFESLEVDFLDCSVKTYLDLVFHLNWEDLAVEVGIRMAHERFLRLFSLALKLENDLSSETKLLILEICLIKINQVESQESVYTIYLNFIQTLVLCPSIQMETICKVISKTADVLLTPHQNNIDSDSIKFWTNLTHLKDNKVINITKEQLKENLELKLKPIIDILEGIHLVLQQQETKDLSYLVLETFQETFVAAFKAASILTNLCNNFNFDNHPVFEAFQNNFRGVYNDLFEQDLLAFANNGKELVSSAKISDLIFIILESSSLLSNEIIKKWIQENLKHLTWVHLHAILRLPKDLFPNLSTIFVQLFANQMIDKKLEIYNLWLDLNGTSERLLQKNSIQHINEAFNKNPDKTTLLNFLIQSPKLVVSKLLCQVIDNASKVSSVDKMLLLVPKLCLYKPFLESCPFLIERCKELAYNPNFSEQHSQNLNKFIIKASKDKSEKIIKKKDLLKFFILPNLEPEGKMFDISIELLQFLISDKGVPWLMKSLDIVALLLSCIIFATSCKENYNGQRADDLLNLAKGISPFAKTVLDENDIRAISRVAQDLPPSTYLYLSPLLEDNKIEEKENSLEFALFGYNSDLIVSFLQSENPALNYLLLVSALVQVFPSSTHTEMHQFLVHYKHLVKSGFLVLPEDCEGALEGFLQFIGDILSVAVEADLYIPWSYIFGFLMILLKKWSHSTMESFFLGIVRLATIIPAYKSSLLSLLLSDIIQISPRSSHKNLRIYIKLVPFPNIRRQLIDSLDKMKP